jgi:hypothetical protein
MTRLARLLTWLFPQTMDWLASQAYQLGRFEQRVDDQSSLEALGYHGLADKLTDKLPPSKK